MRQWHFWSQSLIMQNPNGNMYWEIVKFSTRFSNISTMQKITGMEKVSTIAYEMYKNISLNCKMISVWGISLTSWKYIVLS